MFKTPIPVLGPACYRLFQDLRRGTLGWVQGTEVYHALQAATGEWSVLHQAQFAAALSAAREAENIRRLWLLPAEKHRLWGEIRKRFWDNINEPGEQVMSLRTPTGVLSFPALFKPRAPAPGAEPRYSLNLVFDAATQKSPEFLALKQAVMDVIETEVGASKARDKAFLAGLRLPFRDAGEKSYAGYAKGLIYIAAWSKERPGIVDARLQEVLVPDDVWPGQLARCTVKPFWFSNSGNKGVSFGLNNVQIVKADMPRLDGRRKATDDFDTVAGAAGADGDDDLPLPF